MTTNGLRGLDMRQGVLERYRQYLPITDTTPIFTLGEGSTPLVKSRKIGERIGCDQLYFKLEGCNPTGSFKDRGMVVAVAKAIEAGAEQIACASTGNTSASAAAYGSYYGLSTIVFVPKGNIAKGKLAQAVAYGARIMAIDGSFDDALSIVRSVTEKHPIALINSINPNRIQGQKTAAFEIIEDLEESPDEIYIPVGNAGNITAYWLGFTEAFNMEWINKRPRMRGFQAEGAAPIVQGEPVSNPETIATAIRVGRPASWSGAVNARDESQGSIEAVSDDEIMEAYKMIAREEGVFCEPASAASIAGLLKAKREGKDFSDKKVVCILTGNGLKDPDLAGQLEPLEMQEFSANLSDVERGLKLN